MVPLVGKLKKFYEFSQRLGIHPPVLPPQGRSHSSWLQGCVAARYCEKLRVSKNKRGRQMSCLETTFLKWPHTHTTSIYDLNCLRAYLQH